MRFNRMRISAEASHSLRTLKARTGLTPNVLCRLGLALSLNDTSPAEWPSRPQDGLEFNRPTLMGEWDPLIVALLTQRCLLDGIPVDDANLTHALRGHLERGVVLLLQRIRSLESLGDLLSSSLRAGSQTEQGALP